MKKNYFVPMTKVIVCNFNGGIMDNATTSVASKPYRDTPLF